MQFATCGQMQIVFQPRDCVDNFWNCRESELKFSPLDVSLYLVKVTTQRECERDGFKLAGRGCVQDH